MGKTVRIGNSSGFWGDEPKAMKRQVAHGQLDYLVADYLAEVSMSILHKQMMRQPDLGYVPDFITHLEIAEDELKKRFPKIVTNAGGKNPVACALAVQRLLSSWNIKKKVIAVTGDDLMPEISSLSRLNAFENLETCGSFQSIHEHLAVANAYTSSEGIVKALQLGADIVITGRASDSALTIGPLVHELGWETDDWDRMAAGMVAGHILECGSQATGGNFTDWKSVVEWNEMAYPIVEVEHDGSFTVSKTATKGGLLNSWTVKEQLVYEIADPQRYMGPDVVADLTTMTVEDISDGLVRVEGVSGQAPPHTWKVSMAHADGYKATGGVVIGGTQAIEKARLIESIFWERFDFEFDKQSVQRIGGDALGETLANNDTNEVLLQFSAFDTDKEKLDVFSKEIAGLILSGPQGMAAYGGRPKIQQVIAYWPTLVHKSGLTMELLEVDSQCSVTSVDHFVPKIHGEEFGMDQEKIEEAESIVDITRPYDGAAEVCLSDICLARSGDKGNSANIGVLARTPSIYSFIKVNLTSAMIMDVFKGFCKGGVLRYEMDNLQALNFILTEVLDGGGTRSGRIDPQGKMLASALLAKKVYVPKVLLEGIRK